MKLSVLLSVAAALVSSAQGFDLMTLLQRPTVEDAASIARTLINRESLANLNTIYQTGDDKGLPTSFVEYYADCGDDGSPVFLAVNMGTSFRNINEGSPVTLTIRTGDHAFDEDVNREYPGSRPKSVAGSPRINLRGKFQEITSEDSEAYNKVEKCFLNRHKDAAWWLPGNPIHKTHFVKFNVEDIYFLGGFGDTGYIGKIPVELYRNSSILDDFDEEGSNLSVLRTGDDDIKDWAFEAYLMKHQLMDLSNGFYSKIDTQYQLISEYVKNQEDNGDDVVLDLSNEESSSILDLFKSRFSKRDNSETDLQFKLKDLSKENLTVLLGELDSLKSEIVEYTATLVAKYENLSTGSRNDPHHDFKQDPHHKFNKDPHHDFKQDSYHKLSKDDPHHKFNKDPHHKFNKDDPHHDFNQESYHKLNKDDPHHKFNKDPHHKFNKDPHHDFKQESYHKFNKDDPHHKFNKDPHHDFKKNHPLIPNKPDSDPRKVSLYGKDPHHSKPLSDAHHGKKQLKIQGDLQNYRIVESSFHGDEKTQLKPGFYSNVELYKVHHNTEEVPEGFEEEMVIVVPSKDEVAPKLVNQAGN